MQLLLDLGLQVGSRCEFTCDKRLHHVFCNPISNKCECEKNYPVKIGGSSVSLDNRFSFQIVKSHFTFLDDNPQKGARKGCAKRKLNTQVTRVRAKFNDSFYDNSACSQKTRRTMLLRLNMPACR